MALSIELLGRPRIVRDTSTSRETAPVRGHKAWGLLAYLVTATVPPSRERLVDLLFGDAADPMGALRWNLSQLRRALGDNVELGGDPVRLALPSNAVVDVLVLTRGTWVEALELPQLGQQLLAGISFDTSPALQLWLDGERRHLVGVTEAVLQEAARSRLAQGDAQAAADLATRLVDLTPLDENAHVLLILALRAAGAHEQAAAHARASAELLRNELGIDAGPILRTALDTSSFGAQDVVDRAGVHARIEAGESAATAGAFAAGLDTLRRAALDARGLNDPHLLAQALVTLGTALVHAARGTDEEGAAVLLEGGRLAIDAADPSLASTAYRELAYIAVLRGQYERSLAWLHTAREHARTDARHLCWIELVAGQAYTDLGRHANARASLLTAIAAATDTGDRRCLTFAQASLGRLLIQREEWDEARRTLSEAVALAKADGWLSFRPYPEALLAEVMLADGRLDPAAAAFESAYALGRQIGDPCWESLAVRGAGLVAARRGDRERGLELLAEAPRACRRLPDTYQWISGYGQEARNTVALDHDAPAAAKWINEFEAFAARHDLRELRARGAIQRVRLGEPGALEVARALVAEVDNPALSARLATVS